MISIVLLVLSGLVAYLLLLWSICKAASKPTPAQGSAQPSPNTTPDSLRSGLSYTISDGTTWVQQDPTGEWRALAPTVPKVLQEAEEVLRRSQE